MMKFTVLCTGKSNKLIHDIIMTEDLSVTVERSVNALGDSIIEVIGSKEEIRTLSEIYRMVK